jgi:hypothetical protein
MIGASQPTRLASSVRFDPEYMAWRSVMEYISYLQDRGICPSLQRNTRSNRENPLYYPSTSIHLQRGRSAQLKTLPRIRIISFPPYPLPSIDNHLQPSAGNQIMKRRKLNSVYPPNSLGRPAGCVNEAKLIA